jgi:hypothetical protein
LHTNLLKLCINLGRKNFRLFNLNHAKRDTLEKTSLINTGPIDPTVQGGGKRSGVTLVSLDGAKLCLLSRF